MGTIKSYTDLEQSKKLAEILPLESADMKYIPIMDIDSMSNSGFLETPEYYPYSDTINWPADYLPCWSLAALLKIIGHYILQTVSKDKKVFIVSEENYPICSDSYSEPVDACYEMILKLHKLKML